MSLHEDVEVFIHTQLVRLYQWCQITGYDEDFRVSFGDRTRNQTWLTVFARVRDEIELFDVVSLQLPRALHPIERDALATNIIYTVMHACHAAGRPLQIEIDDRGVEWIGQLLTSQSGPLRGRFECVQVLYSLDRSGALFKGGLYVSRIGAFE